MNDDDDGRRHRPSSNKRNGTFAPLDPFFLSFCLLNHPESFFSSPIRRTLQLGKARGRSFDVSNPHTYMYCTQTHRERERLVVYYISHSSSAIRGNKLGDQYAIKKDFDPKYSNDPVILPPKTLHLIAIGKKNNRDTKREFNSFSIYSKLHRCVPGNLVSTFEGGKWKLCLRSGRGFETMAIIMVQATLTLFCCWGIFSSGAAIISHPMCVGGGGNNRERVAQATIVTIVEQTGQAQLARQSAGLSLRRNNDDGSR